MSIALTAAIAQNPRNCLRFPSQNNAISAAGWGTPPSNLTNATNGDPSSPTGTGSTVKTGAGGVGSIYIDLKEKKKVLLSGTFNMKIASGSGTITVFAYFQTDLGSWKGGHMAVATTTSTAGEEVQIENAPVFQSRYIQFSFYASAAMTAEISIGELEFFELLSN